MASSARSGVRSIPGVSTIAATSSSKSSSADPRGGWIGSSGPSDLGGVREIEDRQRVPALRDRAATAGPHRADVALERVEVPDGWRPQDRRTERQLARGQDRVVIVIAGLEALEDVPQCLHAQAASEVIVEGGQGRPMQDAVVREARIGLGQPAVARPPDRAIEPGHPPDRVRRPDAKAFLPGWSALERGRSASVNLTEVATTSRSEGSQTSARSARRLRQDVAGAAQPQIAIGVDRPGGRSLDGRREERLAVAVRSRTAPSVVMMSGPTVRPLPSTVYGPL